MTITRIAKTRQGRYALFDEADEFLFSIDEETLVRRHICEGLTFAPHELADLRNASDAQKAKEKALVYLSLRDYASKELYDKLCLKFDPHTAAAALAEVCRMGLVNDDAFAVHRAASLAKQKKSTREIRQHLQQKGISRETVQQVLEDLAPQDEDACCALIRKRYLGKLQAGETQKVLAALARRGFTYSDSKRAIATCLQQAQADAEDFDAGVDDDFFGA